MSLVLKKILCAVDFSEPSRKALRAAMDLASRFDCELTLLHVYQMPGYAFPEGVVMAGPEVLNELVGRIDKVLGEWKKECEDRGLTNVKTETAMGIAHVEIVRIAAEGSYDMLVIGTHGRTGLKHALLGSIAERVIRTAPCPVLTVRLAEH